jgi:hypothetical protein
LGRSRIESIEAVRFCEGACAGRNAESRRRHRADAAASLHSMSSAQTGDDRVERKENAYCDCERQDSLESRDEWPLSTDALRAHGQASE